METIDLPPNVRTVWHGPDRTKDITRESKARHPAAATASWMATKETAQVEPVVPHLQLVRDEGQPEPSES